MKYNCNPKSKHRTLVDIIDIEIHSKCRYLINIKVSGNQIANMRFTSVNNSLYKLKVFFKLFNTNLELTKIGAVKSLIK